MHTLFHVHVLVPLHVYVHVISTIQAGYVCIIIHVCYMCMYMCMYMCIYMYMCTCDRPCDKECLSNGARSQHYYNLHVLHNTEDT